jgi:hypothetical protein
MDRGERSSGSSKWHRVFGINEGTLPPESLLDYLQEYLGQPPVSAEFRGDELGWFEADLELPGVGPLVILRYLSSEEGIRAELNTWAAWLEVHAPNAEPYMQHVIRTKQLFTFCSPGAASDFSLDLCRFLARQTDGLIQVDGQGFLTADGTVIVGEQLNE